jgi:hypothetical protein
MITYAKRQLTTVSWRFCLKHQKRMASTGVATRIKMRVCRFVEKILFNALTINYDYAKLYCRRATKKETPEKPGVPLC